MRVETFGGLTVHMAGGTDGNGGGRGPTLVLLHGWAAPGDDLVALWQFIDAPEGTKFLFPEGSLPVNTGLANSRAWWMIDMEKLERDFASGRPRNVTREVPPGLAPAREQILAFLNDAKERGGVALEETILGGFSQGAMLACDVALRSDIPLGGLALLSGSLLARDEWVPLMPNRKGLAVLQSHGSDDPVLPFFLAEQLRDFLTDAGLDVDWLGFRGGHEIPEQVLIRLGRFLHRVQS